MMYRKILVFNKQEERDTADLAEIEQRFDINHGEIYKLMILIMIIKYMLGVINIEIFRSALLAEVHTYNRRYSGEPRTLMEMIR